MNESDIEPLDEVQRLQQLQQQQAGDNQSSDNATSASPARKGPIVGIAPGSSIDWHSNSFGMDSSSGGSGCTTTSTSSSSTVVAITEQHQSAETNLNGLTANLNQLALSSPKTVRFCWKQANNIFLI